MRNQPLANKVIVIGLIIQISLLIGSMGAFWQRVNNIEKQVDYIQVRLDSHIASYAIMKSDKSKDEKR